MLRGGAERSEAERFRLRNLLRLGCDLHDPEFPAVSMPEDMERTMQVFDLLLGDNLQGRKDHIAENGYKYLDQLDVS